MLYGTFLCISPEGAPMVQLLSDFEVSKLSRELVYADNSPVSDFERQRVYRRLFQSLWTGLCPHGCLTPCWQWSLTPSCPRLCAPWQPYCIRVSQPAMARTSQKVLTLAGMAQARMGAHALTSAQ